MKTKNSKIIAGTGHINITPFGLAKISEGFYKAAKNYDSKDIFLVNLFLYCASIEIGLKSAILSKDNSKTKKDFVRYNIGHDINKAVEEFNRLFGSQKFIDSGDLAVIQKINKYYKNKGLEYLTGDVIYSLARGGRGFPELSEIEKINDKLIHFLEQNKFFIDV